MLSLKVYGWLLSHLEAVYQYFYSITIGQFLNHTLFEKDIF